MGFRAFVGNAHFFGQKKTSVRDPFGKLSVWGKEEALKKGPISRTSEWAINFLEDFQEGKWPLTQSGALAHEREQKISKEFFRPKLFHGRPRRMSAPKCFIFPGCGGPWPDVRRDIRPKNFLFGVIFRS